MFGKIKDKLKGVFEKNQEIIEEENQDNYNENTIDNGKEISNSEINQETNIKTEKEIENTDNKPEDYNKDNNEIEEEKEEKKGFFKNLFSKSNKNKDDSEDYDEDKNNEDNNNENKNNENNNNDNNEIEKEKKQIEIKKESNENEEIKNSNNDNYNDNNINNDKVNKKEEIEEEKENNEKDNIENEGIISKTFKKLKSKKLTEEDFNKIWLDLEIFLLEINIAFEIVEKIETRLKEELIGGSFDRFNLNEKIRNILIDEIEKVLIEREGDLLNEIKKLRNNGELVKILILGVNGTGKTTTIAKFINYLQKENLSVVVAAADTFRAAAIEQLDEHSKKLNFKLISHKGGSDPAAVAYDAIEHAKAKNLDIVLIDTAGRMPNNSNLMMELQKIKRVSESQISIFVGDSISGNDLIEQINLFDSGINIDGVILTKVDTDERPGSIVTCAYSINKPIFFLGIGQEYDDLIKFNAKEIAEKLFNIDDE